MWVPMHSLILNPANKLRFESCLKDGVSRIWTRFGQVFIADSNLRKLQIFSLNDASHQSSHDSAIERVINLQQEIVNICFPSWCVDSFWIVTRDAFLHHFVKSAPNATWCLKSNLHLLMESPYREDNVTEVLVHDTHRAIYFVSCGQSNYTMWKISVLTTGQHVTLGQPKVILEKCPPFCLVESSTLLYGWANGTSCPPNVFFTWSSTGQLTVKNTTRSEWVCESVVFRQVCWEAVTLWAQNPSKIIKQMLTWDKYIVLIDEEFQVLVLRERDGKAMRNFALDRRDSQGHVTLFRGTLLTLRETSIHMYDIISENTKVISVPSPCTKIYVSKEPTNTLYVYSGNCAFVMWAKGTVYGSGRPILDLLDGWISTYKDGAQNFKMEVFKKSGYDEMNPPVTVDAAIAFALARKRHDTMVAEGKSCNASAEMKELIRDVKSERSGISLRKPIGDICEKYVSLIDAMDEMLTDCKSSTSENK